MIAGMMEEDEDGGETDIIVTKNHRRWKKATAMLMVCMLACLGAVVAWRAVDRTQSVQVSPEDSIELRLRSGQKKKLDKLFSRRRHSKKDKLDLENVRSIDDAVKQLAIIQKKAKEVGGLAHANAQDLFNDIPLTAEQTVQQTSALSKQNDDRTAATSKCIKTGSDCTKACHDPCLLKASSTGCDIDRIVAEYKELGPCTTKCTETQTECLNNANK